MMHPQELANCIQATQMLIKTLRGEKYTKERFNLINLRDTLKAELNPSQNSSNNKPQGA
jgi:hypothetical protein